MNNRNNIHTIAYLITSIAIAIVTYLVEKDATFIPVAIGFALTATIISQLLTHRIGRLLAYASILAVSPFLLAMGFLQLFDGPLEGISVMACGAVYIITTVNACLKTANKATPTE